MSSEAVCEGCGHTYQRLPHAKSGLCCSCRRVKRERRKTLKRQPTNDPAAFQTQAALDEWYAQDELKCHLCGEHFAGLYKHVGMVHGITTCDYKARFGIPMTYGLSGRSTRGKHRACAAATVEKMARSGFANLERGRAARGDTRMAWTPYQTAEHVTRMTEAPGHPSNYEGDTELTCTVCGDKYFVPATIALSRQCRAKCPSCKK